MKLSFAMTPPEKVLWGTTPSPIGKLAIGVTEKGTICRVAFLRDQKAIEAMVEWQAEWPTTVFSRAADVSDYERKPILLIGTPFQQSVWQAIARIPKGSVATYATIAEYIGNPLAARAVGGACGKNPVPYLVPCHRVVASNGGLGGFSSGLEIKRELLKDEGWL